MQSTNIYSTAGELQYTPYVYKITLTRGDDTKYYIGSKTHRNRTMYLDGKWYQYANPQLFLDGLYNGTGKVNDYINDGWSVSNREIIKTFEGNDDGYMQCCRYEGELLRGVNAKGNDQYVNGNNAGARESLNSKVVSEDTKQKMRDAWVQRRKVGVSDETRKKMSEAHKGKHKGPRKGWDKEKVMSACRYSYEVRFRWPDEKIEQLLQMHKDGMSNFAIGKALGGQLGSNAIKKRLQWYLVDSKIDSPS